MARGLLDVKTVLDKLIEWPRRMNKEKLGEGNTILRNMRVVT